MIIVRPARDEDADEMSNVLVASITQLCFADHRDDPEVLAGWLANKTPAGVRGMLANPQARFLLAICDEAIGGVSCYFASREIGLNYVSPTHRFSGVSKTLLRAMEVELGPGEATLTSTRTARPFYLAMGWKDADPAEAASYPMRKLL